MSEICKNAWVDVNIINEVSGLSETMRCGKPLNTKKHLAKLRASYEEDMSVLQAPGRDIEDNEESLRQVDKYITDILSRIEWKDYSVWKQEFSLKFNWSLSEALIQRYWNMGSLLYNAILKCWESFWYEDGSLDYYFRNIDQTQKMGIKINLNSWIISGLEISELQSN